MNLTREQIQTLEQTGQHMPNGFTGVWKGQHHYKGIRWHGPTNLMGVSKKKYLEYKEHEAATSV